MHTGTPQEHSTDTGSRDSHGGISGSLVSIVIPTYFRNDQLQEAIESALNQSYEPVEIIVVDDSGERHAEPVCTDADVTYIPHEVNQGGNPARNTGIEAASGEYVQFLDDDDRLAETKIEKQVALFADSPNVGVVYCGLEEPAGEEVYPTSDARGDIFYHALRIYATPSCQTGTMLIRSVVLEKIYPLADRRAADDIGMLIRLARETEFDYVDEVLFYKGGSAEHRGMGIDPRYGVMNIIQENMSAYESAPESVYREGMKLFYLNRGHVLLHESRWSFEAIRSFWRAVTYADGFDPVLFASLVSSLFGSPGLRAASLAYRRVN
jgi:glycosyltransferase involved in cell wall biosynthesis